MWMALGLAVAMGWGAEARAEEPEPADSTPEAAEASEEEELKWAKTPIDYRHETEFTAYSLKRGAVRIGLFNLDYGLTDDFSVGTSPLLAVYGFYSVRAKSTMLTLGRFDASLETTVGYLDASRLSELSAGLINYPITLRFSYSPFDRLGLHAGWRWQNVDVVGTFAINDIAETLAPVIGVKLPNSVKSSLGQAGSLYAGAHFTLDQPLFAIDWRFNRRDSLIFQYEGYSGLRGRIDGGYQANDSTEYVAGVRAKEELWGQVKGTTTLSWQFSYERFALRVGIPLTTPADFTQDYTPLFVIRQAFTVYWIL